MKGSRLIAVACAFMLAGCQHFQKDARRGLEGFNPGVVRQPQPQFPNVFITDTGGIVLDQEPIRIGKRHVVEGRVRISWALAAGSPYTFPANGIVLGPGPNRDTPQELRCGVQGAQAKIFECSYRAPERRATYKYTVNVRQGDKLLEALDPFVVNEH